MACNFLGCRLLDVIILGLFAQLTSAVASRAEDHYVLEFRSRASEYFGHNYVVLRHTSVDHVVHFHSSGFGPAPDSSNVDSVLGTRGWVGVEPSDRTAPVTQRFGVSLSRKAYIRILLFIKRMTRRPPTFSLFDYNCNSYLGDVARVAGLEVPRQDTQFPDQYVAELRELNTQAIRQGSMASVPGAPRRSATRAGLQVRIFRPVIGTP